MLRADIIVQGEAVGAIEVYYTQQMPQRRRGAVPQGGAQAHRHDRRAPGPFLMQRRLLAALRNWQSARRERLDAGAAREWWVIVEFLRHTDQHLLMRIRAR